MTDIVVLFQKEARPEADYIPAREVHIFSSQKPAVIEKEAMRKIRPGFRAYLVKFKTLPPEHILINACEEAVRNKACLRLPDAQPTKKKILFNSAVVQ